MITKERALELIDWEIRSYEAFPRINGCPMDEFHQEYLDLFRMAKKAIEGEEPDTSAFERRY